MRRCIILQKIARDLRRNRQQQACKMQFSSWCLATFDNLPRMASQSQRDLIAEELRWPLSLSFAFAVSVFCGFCAFSKAECRGAAAPGPV